MNRKNILFLFLFLHLLIGGILILPVMAATTELTITKYANDGITVLNQTTKNYAWLEANLPVKGDGSTHYFHQGPTFNDSDPYDPGEYQNVLSRDWGAVKGTDVKDLCGLVGGAHTGDIIRIKAADGLTLNYPYEYVYTPNSRQGPMVIAWYNGEESNGGYENQGTGYPPSYFKGMRLIMFADTSTNPWGYHVFGNNDMLQVWAPQYRYNYSGIWPSAGGISEQNVRYISIMSTESAPSPPSAMFMSDVQIGTAPLTVRFTDQSTGTAPFTYAWDFNNDRTVDSTLRNPTFIYTTAGTYSVNLTVTNSAGSDSERKTNYITVNAAPVPPVAAFVSDVQSGNAPLLVYFTDQSTNTPTSWKWEYRADAGSWTEFGSGARNPSRSFTAGTYDIRLTATNSGGSDSELKTDYITAGTQTSPPVADFLTDITNGPAPLTVKFTDASTGTGITVWQWDFNNDGIIDSTSRNPSYIYESTGTFTITLTVTGTGGSDSEIKNNYITVTNAPVTNTETQIGIFRPSSGYWYFDYNLDGSVDKSFKYGGSTDQIIVGDWDGDGKDGIAIFRPSSGYWYFDYNLDSIINKSFRYGGSTDQIIVGDWDGDGKDGIAIFRPSSGYWYFDYNLDGRVDKSFRYGGSTDRIIVGDWDGDGKDGIAIFRPSSGYWYFDYNLDGRVDQSFRYGGSTDQIIVGDWDGDGKDGIAIFRPSSGYWYFDYDLDGRVDKSFRYGGSTDRIIVGKWA